MSHDTKDFLKSQIDKLVLAFLIVYFTIFMGLLLLRFPNLDASTLQWIEKSVDMVTGALIGAVTTGALIRRSESSTEIVTPASPGLAGSTKRESESKSEVGPATPKTPVAADIPQEPKP